MLKLNGVIENHIGDASLIGTPLRVTTNRFLPDILKNTYTYVMKSNNFVAGFQNYIIFPNIALPAGLEPDNYIRVDDSFNYLSDDDIVIITPKMMRVLYRRNSTHNSILVTERCNNYCLMCSQPPKSRDSENLKNEIRNLIPLIPRSTGELCFTGGEPSYDKEFFLEILNLTKSYLPDTRIHILSNGRSFKDYEFAKKYASIGFDDCMIGIPVYSDDPTLHDYIVQARNAFDETIEGIINLKQLRQKVEIRVVLHQLTVRRLPSLCEYITRNLVFVDHIALMGLEITGFTRANLNQLWIDPYDYRDQLEEAVQILASYHLNVSLYNLPLCLVDSHSRQYCRQSISDWKREYAEECGDCHQRSVCSGLFSSGVRYKHSEHLHAL